MEDAAEFVQIKFQHCPFAIAGRHLVVARHIVVDGIDALLGRECLRDALGEQAVVVGVVEQEGACRPAVASCPTGLLEVSLDGIGQIEMNDQSHIGLVDAHPKGVGGHHHAGASRLPCLLARIFVGSRESGVVVER